MNTPTVGARAPYQTGSMPSYFWKNLGDDPVALPTALHPRGLETLDKTYSGPILVVSSPAIVNEHGPMVGSQHLLFEADAQGVPIVYVNEPDTRKGAPSNADLLKAGLIPPGEVVQGAPLPARKGLFSSPQPTSAPNPLDGLKAQFPKAKLFVIGHTNGLDALNAQGTGATAYLINTDPTQKQVPKGFRGPIVDDFDVALQSKILSDLQRAQGQTAATVAAPPSIPAAAKTTPVDTFRVLHENLFHPFTGVPSFFLQKAWSGIRSVHGLVSNVNNGKSDLSKLSSQQRADMASRIMVGRLATPEAKSHALLKILQSAATPGARDAVVSRMEHPHLLPVFLHGADKADFDTWVDRTKAVPGDWDGFQKYVDDLTGSREVDGSKMQPLINGDQVFPARLDAIKHAKNYINCGTFIFNSDEAGYEMADALIEAAQRGVKVRVFYDTVGSAKTYGKPTDDAVYKKMKAAGIEVIEHPPAALGDHLSHRKILTMDDGANGHVGFSGGMNVGNEYRVRWHDVDSKISGSAAVELNRMFIDPYREWGGHLSDAEEKMMMTPGPALADGGKIRVVGHIGMHDQDTKKMYLRAIDTANENIRIANPYVSDPEVIEHLCAAARRGVDVELFTPHNVDDATLQKIGRTYYAQLIAAGAKVYEYAGRPMAHEKLATFDNRITTIGTCNFDRRSLFYNDEDNPISSDPRVAADVNARLFDADRPNSIHYDQYHPDLKTFVMDEATRLTIPLA